MNTGVLEHIQTNKSGKYSKNPQKLLEWIVKNLPNKKVIMGTGFGPPGIVLLDMLFKVTKDMLRGKKIEPDIDKAFINYTKACIEYFKFIDKAEIIQKDYKMYSQKSTTKKDIASIVMPDHLLMGTPPAITKTIPECYPVKVTNKKKKITFFPKRRDIDIKNP